MTDTAVLEIAPNYGPLHSEVIRDSFRMQDGMVLLVTGIMLNSPWGLLGAALIATAVMDWCPLYTILRLNRNRHEQLAP